ncbi:DUF4142 domain-containing protein [Chitinimonas lacunae]|uniref:DUF4142 domain-containing protein n=1 Tax=Chitinimonas lacunae TaxID=1963018 RepID=A0ABV8MKN8_9NEIS
MQPIIGLFVGLCFTLALPAQAADTTPPPATTTPPPNSQVNPPETIDDQTFVQKAGMSGATEIAASKRAVALSASEKVKTFARQMIKDHTKVAGQLKATASKAGLQPPGDEPDPAVMSKLSGLTGADFDKAYIEHVAVKAHADAVSLFSLQAASGKNATMKTWAKRTLPALQHHLTMAQKLAKDSNVTVQPSDTGTQNRTY